MKVAHVRMAAGLALALALAGCQQNTKPVQPASSYDQLMQQAEARIRAQDVNGAKTLFGKMINDAMPFLEPTPLQVFIPALTLMLIVLGVSFLGDGLRDALDPQSLQ